jgi:hypothetical protein
MSDDERLHTVLKENLRRDGGSPEGTIALLGKAARDGLWSRLNQGEDQHPFSSFSQYIETPVAEGGLGIMKADVLHLVAVRTEVERRAGCVMTDRAAELENYRNLIKQELKGDIGPSPEHGEVGRGRNRDCGTNSNRPMTQDGIVSRLKRDDPELAESVVRGEITANAAARVKGWRYPRVELRNPITVAARIKTTFTPEQIAQLVTELTHTKEV